MCHGFAYESLVRGGSFSEEEEMMAMFLFVTAAAEPKLEGPFSIKRVRLLKILRSNNLKHT